MTTPQDEDWPVTFEQVRRRQLLDVVRNTTPEERGAFLEAMIEELKDFLPDRTTMVERPRPAKPYRPQEP